MSGGAIGSCSIAAVTTRLPQLFDPEEAIDILYPPTLAEGRVNRLAKKAAKGVGIRNRPSVLDPTRFPERSLAQEGYRPVAWCGDMVAEFTRLVPAGDIGFLSIAYNISSDPNLLPNIAARVVKEQGLSAIQMAEERPFYGCAGGLFSLESAIRFCSQTGKAAIVCVFDQCSWIVNPVHDPSRPDFKDHLRTSLLFGDGAAGVLVIPDSMRRHVRRPLLRILDIENCFVPGDSIRMEEGFLVLGEELKDEMPRLISERILGPMLARNDLTTADIPEWALHQGGMPIVTKFGSPDTIGISEQQLARAVAFFIRYGNFSAPSCFFVLDSFFNEDPRGKQGRKGMIVSFGAGYYFGAALYEWDLNE